MGITVISPPHSATFLVTKWEADMFKGILWWSFLVALMASPLLAEPGDYEDLGGGYSKIDGMAALDGRLYIISQGFLYVATTDGVYENLGGGWNEIGGMTALDGKLYIISQGTLYETTTTGDYEDLGGGWNEIGGMTAVSGKLYIISQGTLYRTDVR